MTEEVVVIGAGGFGREVLDVIDAINNKSADPVWDVLGVVDDAPTSLNVQRLDVRGVSLIGGVDELLTRSTSCRYVIGVGSPTVRARIEEQLGSWGGRAATLVHPAAVVGTGVTLGAGTVVCAGVQLSTNLRLGAHVHINPGAIIGHDSVLGDFVSINPGAIVSGEVQVGARTLVGAGAVILQGLSTGEDVTVGASACVVRSVERESTVVGVPARPLIREDIE